MKKALHYFMTLLRDKKTDRATFRATSKEIAQLLALKTMESLTYEKITITTPLDAQTTGYVFTKRIVLIPILRSGIALIESFFVLFPHADVGFMGLKRDEKTAIAHRYYENIPPIGSDDIVIILDPMIATGGSACDLLHFLREKNIEQKQIFFANIICAPEGVATIKKEFPNITLISLVTDEHLNDQKFIVPGIGDFGDRYFGTE